MSNSARDAARRLRPLMYPRCSECRLTYPESLIRQDGICIHCWHAQERIREAAAAAAEYIKLNGQEAWDEQLAAKLKELY